MDTRKNHLVNANYRNHAHYITEGWSQKPKEIFKKLASLIQNQSGHENDRVLDVGCATGELIYYLKSRFGGMDLTGVDIFPELIEEAQQMVPFAQFQMASVMDLPQDFADSYDIVLAMGVLGIFDIEEAPRFFENLSRCTHKGGKIYVSSHFNDHPADVMIRHRKRMNGKLGDWERGWNIYSKETIGEILQGQCKTHQFHEFHLPIPLAPKPDPVRSWTIRTEHNPYQLVNGLKLMIDLSILEIVV